MLGVDILPAAEVGITDLLGDGVTAIAAGELEVTVGGQKNKWLKQGLSSLLDLTILLILF